jgi:hypothetical protein
MGTSQKSSVHIPTFLQRNQGDPVVKVSNLLFFTGTEAHTSTIELFLKTERTPSSSRSSTTSAGG